MFQRSGLLLPVVLLALVLRLGWALAVPVLPVSDSAMYDAFAREIAAGRGYVYPDGSATAYWPVGPSALYGLFYALFGAAGWTVAAVNVLLGTCLVAVTHRLAAIRFGGRLGLVAGLLMAIWPMLIQFTTILNSELPFLLFLMAALLVREAANKRPLLNSGVAAALLTASAYMRPTSLPLIFLLPILDILRHRRVGRGMLDLAVSVAVAAALLGPWAARNQDQLGAPVLVSTNFGPNLWMGNNPASTGGYMPLPKEDFGGEVEREAALKQRALDFILARPDRYLELSAARFFQSFSRETIGVAWNERGLPPSMRAPLKVLSTAFWWAAFALSLLGVALFLLPKPIRIFDPIIICPGLFAAVAVLVVAQDRYHMPLNPFVAIFAAYGIEQFRRRKRAAKQLVEDV